MPKINVMLLKLDGFQYPTSLDLNMGYYRIQITEDANNLCMFTIPYGKYHYKRLPMRVDSLPEILQQKMNDLFQGFEFIRACIDKI